jgi:PleD family two-component response regulator
MDGLEALAILMAADATRGIPVVMLSNYDDHSLVARSLQLGAKEYIVKINIRPTDLVGVVERWSRPAA